MKKLIKLFKHTKRQPENSVIISRIHFSAIGNVLTTHKLEGK